MKILRSPRIMISLVLLLTIGLAIVMRPDLDPEILEAQIVALGYGAPIVFVLIFAAATVLFLPGTLFGLIGGAIFGPVWGTIWNLMGALLGCALAFLVSRYLLANWIRQKASGRAAQVIAGIDAEGWRFVMFVRLVPLFPFNLLNYLLGLTKLRFRDYILTSAVCMLPGIVAITYLGYAGREAMNGSEATIRNGMIALGLLVAVIYLPTLVKMVRRKGNWIKPHDLVELLEKGDTLTIIDVRSPQEFNGPLGHIQGAQNIPLERLPGQLSRLREIPFDELYLICHTDKRSMKAAELLSKKSAFVPHIVRGGMTQWCGKIEVEFKEPSSSEG